MPELRPFTHRIYVDFSGDDGDPQTSGASKVICIAWVLSAEGDLRFNEGIVLKIKQIIGCSSKAELKYKSLRRHRRKMEALELLSGARVRIVLVPVLKKRITSEELRNPKTKRLVTVLHSFPLSSLVNYFQESHPDVYFQLVFDEVGWAGCQDEIRKSFAQMEKESPVEVRPDWLRFLKSESNLLLQLADLVAGLGREYFEDLQNKESKEMPPCGLCQAHGWNTCRFKRKRLGVGRAKLLRLLHPLLLRDSGGKTFNRGFIARPPEIAQSYRFVDCLF